MTHTHAQALIARGAQGWVHRFILQSDWHGGCIRILHYFNGWVDSFIEVVDAAIQSLPDS
eukprot:2353389-Karenia_brevis.AAC.1